MLEYVVRYDNIFVSELVSEMSYAFLRYSTPENVSLHSVTPPSRRHAMTFSSYFFLEMLPVVGLSSNSRHTDTIYYTGFSAPTNIISFLLHVVSSKSTVRSSTTGAVV